MGIRLPASAEAVSNGTSLHPLSAAGRGSTYAEERCGPGARYTFLTMTDTLDPATALNPPPVPAEPGSAVTLAEVRHVAALASLELTPAEEASMERDLNAILGYIAELNELDTSAVEPMAQVSEVLPGRSAASSSAGLRLDEPRASLPRATVMAGAPATDGTFFKVPKVIER